MNFMHSITIIMAGSGFKKVLTGAFGSVDIKMFIPKTFEQCICWLKVLQSVSMTELDKRTSCSRTVTLWKYSLGKPVIIMMAFSREVNGCGTCLLRRTVTMLSCCWLPQLRSMVSLMFIT